MASPKSLKRTYEEAGFETQPFVQRHGHENTTTPPTTRSIPDFANDQPLSSASAQPNITVPSLKDSPSSGQTVDVPLTSNNRLAETTKKPKLSFAEKEVKDQQRAEERAKKEEERLRRERDKSEKEQERAKKAEEKRLKEEEKRKAREERERVKAEEKARKEEEKQKKEEEKNKKARVCLFPYCHLP